MDIIFSLSNAVSLASRLKEISKNIENAEFKNLLADLCLELADAKIKIAGLLSENAELKEELHALTSADGELCPKCRNRTFELISSKPHAIFGDAGAKERDFKCSNCGFEESQFIEP